MLRTVAIIQDVTIAVTTKDRPDLTLLAVDSARASAPHVRIVVVDSGSTEANLHRLRTGLRHAELHIGSYPNAAAARNAALRLVDSEFVGFLDSDDLMRREKITCLQPLLRRNPDAVLAVGRTEVIDARGIGRDDLTQVHAALYTASEEASTSYASQCVRFTAFTSATLMRSAALEEVGGYDELLPAMEDVDLYLRLSLMGTIETSRCVAADYRIWSENVGAVKSAEGFLAVASKHLAALPDLPDHERRAAERALSMRSAQSQQTLLRRSDARRSLIRAARADPTRAFMSVLWWRILAASLVSDEIIDRRRRSSERGSYT